MNMTKTKTLCMVAAVLSTVALAAFGGEVVWDATKDGRVMTETNDILLFKGALLNELYKVIFIEG